jgi:hypothetical protein
MNQKGKCVDEKEDEFHGLHLDKLTQYLFEVGLKGPEYVSLKTIFYQYML